ncbi:hypothetical protein MP228_010691 [Amoeboaphelidium protococcarum]|nr:hypothetical protein MP228_010691 [Amoeboaphelidium protococcarum]
MNDNVIHAIAGAGGGIISMALTYPLITVGTRLQIQQNKKTGGQSDANQQYKGLVDAFQKIVKHEGVAGLYSGINSALFGIALTNGVYYYFYEFSKSQLLALKTTTTSSSLKNLSVMENLLAGTLAGCLTVFITNPVWLLNTRQASGKGNTSLSEDELSKASAHDQSNSGTIAMLMQIIKEDGLLSLWQGVGPALILVSNPAIQYMVFEQLRQRIEKTKQLTEVDFFVLGALSKLVATFLTYPYIVIKSRMQLRQTKVASSGVSSSKSTANKGSSDTRPKYADTLNSIKTILKEEGVTGLYKGLGSKLTQSVLTAAILFMAKEKLFVITKETALYIASWIMAMESRRQK